jgi:hypothetical protein
VWPQALSEGDELQQAVQRASMNHAKNIVLEARPRDINVDHTMTAHPHEINADPADQSITCSNSPSIDGDPQALIDKNLQSKKDALNKDLQSKADAAKAGCFGSILGMYHY